MKMKEIRIKVRRFFKYFFSVEMILFWFLFAVYSALFLVINFSYLPKVQLLADLLLVFSLFVIILISNFFLTLRNKEISTERNYTAGIIYDLIDGVVAYDKDFLVTVFNPAAERIFGLKKEEMLGKYITPALSNDAKFRTLVQVVFPSLAPAVKNKRIKGYQEEFDIVFHNPYREFHITFDRILSEKKKTLGFVKVIHDSTREKELLKEKGEFLDIAAHNLNTPVTELRWGIESLLDEFKKGSNFAKYLPVLDHLDKTARNLSELIGDILSVARIEKGRFGYTFQETDIVELVEKDLEKWAGIAKRYQLKVYFERPRLAVPKLYIDPVRIKMVLDNLVENAMIYNVKNGEVRVRVEEVAKKPYVIVSVKDTGIGIPEGEKSRIFQKMFRGESAKKYRTEGIGLGLYISRNIVRRHGGEMWFESEEGRGSTFYFSLPTKKELIPPLDALAG